MGRRNMLEFDRQRCGLCRRAGSGKRLEDHGIVKLKLDENLSRQLEGPISQQGHDVSTALEEGLLGKVDVEVGAAAKSEDRMNFTLDLDFADLRKFLPGSHPGVILFRPREELLRVPIMFRRRANRTGNIKNRSVQIQTAIFT
jgi:hypothetical protein